MPDRVALTGATGFIGKSLLHELLVNQYQVRALTRQAQSKLHGVQWIAGDLSDTHALQSLVEDVDCVIHCAGQVRGRSLEDFLASNFTGTLNLVNVSSRRNNPPRFLMISSLAAREPGLSWYAMSKHRGENALIENAGNMHWSIYRPAAVYGRGDKELAPLLKLTKSGILPTSGNLQSRFGLIYVDDLVKAVIKWIEIKVQDNNIYELDDGADGGYDPRLIREIASKVWERQVYIIAVPILLLRLVAIINLGLSRLIRYSPMLTPAKVRELSHHDWVCDLEPIIRDLGWRPEVSLAEGLSMLNSVDT